MQKRASLSIIQCVKATLISHSSDKCTDFQNLRDFISGLEFSRNNALYIEKPNYKDSTIEGILDGLIERYRFKLAGKDIYVKLVILAQMNSKNPINYFLEQLNAATSEPLPQLDPPLFKSNTIDLRVLVDFLQRRGLMLISDSDIFCLEKFFEGFMFGMQCLALDFSFINALSGFDEWLMDRIEFKGSLDWPNALFLRSRMKRSDAYNMFFDLYSEYAPFNVSQ